MQLYPQEEYVVARGLEDHTDNTTYYVRAVIRNGKTDAIIATLDLTDQGDSHRFKKTWQVPADPTGLGFWITIVTSVYTDSGYSTKSSNYGDKYEEKFIEARQHSHGGGGADIDYKKVRKIVKEEVEKAKPEPVEPPSPTEISPILDAIHALQRDVDGIDIPEAIPTDLGPVMAEMKALANVLASVHSDVKAIEIPEAEQTDLSPILNELKRVDFQQAKVEVGQLLTKLNSAVAMLDKMRPFFTEDIDTIKADIQKLLDIELEAEVHTVGPDYQFQKTPVTIKRKAE